MNMNIAVLHLSLESNSHLLCFRLVFIEDESLLKSLFMDVNRM